MQANNPDITYLAKTNFRGTDRVFGIKRKDRRQHMYVLGKSGTGKSTLLENMIIQNMQNGEGICVIDPHGELVEKMVTVVPKERIEDVIYFNPSDTDFAIGFNVLQVDDPKYKHLIASGLMGIFTKIWANTWSSRMEYIMNNCILALLDTPGSTLMGIPRLLVDKDYRQYVISNLKDPVVKAFWIHEFEAWRDQFRNEAIQPIQNKVGQFLSTNIVRNIVGQQKSTIDIFQIMNEQKIFFVNLSKGRIGEDNSALLGAMLITKIQLAAMERVRIPEVDRKDFYLYVDEFQNFVTDSFASILSEARKYRLNLCIAHQYIAQLETGTGVVKDAVFGNVGTMIVFRVGAEDGGALEGEFEPEFTTEDFVNLPNYHIYLKLMVDGVTSRPFSARTLPPIPVEESEKIKSFIIETSRKLYTKPRDEVEYAIDRWSSSVPGSQNRDGEEAGPGKFKAECINCKKSIYVPFEPIPGKPIYCKDCMVKIKNGELDPVPGFKLPRPKDDVQKISYDALAGIGIEFAETKTKPGVKTPTTAFEKKDSSSFKNKINIELKKFPKYSDIEKSQKNQSFSRNEKVNKFNGKPAPINTNKEYSSLGQNTTDHARELNTFLHTVVKQVAHAQSFESIKKNPVPQQQLKQETLSLADLVKQNTSSKDKSHDEPQRKTDTKIARPESVSLLKEAIEKAKQKTNTEKEHTTLSTHTSKENPHMQEKKNTVEAVLKPDTKPDLVSSDTHPVNTFDLVKSRDSVDIMKDFSNKDNTAPLENFSMNEMHVPIQDTTQLRTSTYIDNESQNSTKEDMSHDDSIHKKAEFTQDKIDSTSTTQSAQEVKIPVDQFNKIFE